MALLRIIFLSSIIFTTLIWLFITGKIFLDNIKKEKAILNSLNKELAILRIEITAFKQEIDNLKKKILDKSQS
jgi:cell division protein FtsB